MAASDPTSGLDPAVDRRRLIRRVGLVGGLFGLLQIAGARVARAFEPGADGADDLVGSWMVVDTPPATGGVVNVDIMVHYTRDGGVLTSHTVPQVGGAQTPRDPNDPIFDPEMRGFRYHDTSGMGAWTKTGRRRYAATFVRLTADQQHHGSFAGSVRVRTQIALSERGDVWTGRSTVEVLGPGGEVRRWRASTQRATRIVAMGPRAGA